MKYAHFACFAQLINFYVIPGWAAEQKGMGAVERHRNYRADRQHQRQAAVSETRHQDAQSG